MNQQRIGKVWKELACAAALLMAIWSTPSSASSPQPATILVENFMFTPMTSTIKAGSTVTWVNKDDDPHTVISDTGVFRSAAMDTNETFSFEFHQPGTYHFTCSIHPSMVGTIVVE